MSVALIIAIHGQTAPWLLKTAEMFLGEQKNIACVEFLPGENADTLIEKYHTCLKTLDTRKGVIFLVDMWGGSPFNAASKIITQEKEKTRTEETFNADIITGVNVPMLVETLMARDDNPQFEALINIALTCGREGVKAFNTQTVSVEATTQGSSTSSPPPVLTGYMNIALARIDDRLIHGQVATRWTKETQVSRIIVVSDEVANDAVRKTLLTQVAPPGVTAHVVGVDKMVRVYNNPKYARDRVMLLFTNPTDVLRLVEQDVPISSVNIGGMAFREGKIKLTNAVAVDQKDIQSFKKLHDRDIELEVRKVASDTRLNIMELLSKNGEY